jgi:taurine dioxygenase
MSYIHIKVEPNVSGFGAIVTGVDLSPPVSANVIHEIMMALTKHSVLSFPEQALDADKLQKFSAQLGPFGEDPYIRSMERFNHVIEVKRGAGETAPIFGSLWHSDWSFQEEPPSITCLYGVNVPPHGGDTLFADNYRAYESLANEVKSRIATLNGVHSATRAYSPKGLFSNDDKTRSMKILVSSSAEEKVTHPLVRRHPSSASVQTEFIYRHRWASGTLVLWDNRCVAHLAEGGYEGYDRLMYRTTIAGESPVSGIY